MLRNDPVVRMQHCCIVFSCLALPTNSPSCCVAFLVKDVEAGEEAEEAMEVSISEDPAEAEAQETTQAVGVIFAAVRKHFLLDVPIGTAMC